MFETGIPKLDDYLSGGIPSGKSLIYHTQPGVEGDIFGMQTLYWNLHKGHKAVYVASNSAPYAVKGRFKEFGWNVEKFDQLSIVDCFSALMGADSNERYVVSNPEDIVAIDDAISKAMENAAGGVIVFESLSTIMDHCGEKETLKYIEKWKKYSTAYDNVVICNFTAWPYAKSTLKRIKELFDAVITISGIAKRVIFGQYYGVSKVNWVAKSQKRSISFKVLRPGGVKIFIPKVLVTGPYNAGKSSFIHAISSRAISVDRLGTTVAMDHGFIDHKGFTADIFGTPGQERFDPLLRMLSGEAMGVFLLIDSTKPSTFPRAKKMLEMTRAHGLPYLVVANKQDLPDALSVNAIRKKMKIPESVPIISACVAKKQGVFEAFETLVDMITKAI